MKKLLFFIVALATFQSVVAQVDTLYLYFNQSWEKCGKDTATYYGVAYFNGKLWMRKDYWKSNNQLQMSGSYIDSAFQKEEGGFTYYYENGALKSERKTQNGKMIDAIHYYQNGKKRVQLVYNNDVEKAIGWDENGNEIPNYIFEREAIFPGGSKGWVAYLVENLNADMPAKKGLPAGIYKVKLRFEVTAQGKIENIIVVEAPANCSACAKEAIRVVRKGPNWIPAIQFNKQVLYRAEQSIVFQVEW